MIRLYRCPSDCHETSTRSLSKAMRELATARRIERQTNTPLGEMLSELNRFFLQTIAVEHALTVVYFQCS